MTRSNYIDALYDHIHEEYEIREARDYESALLDMFGGLIQKALEGELDHHLGYNRYDSRNKSTTNSRNGKKPKTIKTRLGETTIMSPRDREGSFEPQIVPKRQSNVAGIEDRVLGLYAKGMSTRDIAASVQDLYSFEVSHEMVSNVTDKIIPHVQEWQNRPLKAVYPIIYLDALHVPIKDGVGSSNRAVHCIIGIDLEGRKDVLSVSIGGTESASYYLGLLDELKARGVKDIGVACVDGLSGFKQAIQAVFPQALVQRCIVHLIRQSTKVLSSKERKDFCYDLKKIYQAAGLEMARLAFGHLKEKWGATHPLAVRVWENNIEEVYQIFSFPQEIRKLIYTTNAIESYNSQLRKVLGGKGAFPNEMAVMKLIYLKSMDMAKSWSRSIPNWGQMLNQFLILYPGRFEPYL